MIRIADFKKFLTDTFSPSILFIDEFKPDLQFAEVDCFEKQSYKLSLEISPEAIKVSAIEKNATLDFSLHDYAFTTNIEAEKFVRNACAKGYYQNPRK